MGHHDERLSDTIRLRKWQESLFLLSEQDVLPAHVRCQLREIARLLIGETLCSGLRSVRR